MNQTKQRGIGMTSQRTRERLISRLREEGIQNEEVLDAIRNTPRHLFVDEALAHRAYEDTALPIGFSQTISQPYIVARMTEIALSRGKPDRLLEIGTGCGYQTAVLAQFVSRVFSVERIEPLLDRAIENLAQIGISNVVCRLADGKMGWDDRGPYNVILSAAAPEKVPEELLAQLAPEGMLIIPVGPEGKQMLTVVHRQGDAKEYKTYEMEPVRFVPLLSGVTR
jgi:protein-L-isoaspartate(D-aspartate) O-methyltransferase